MTVAEQIEGCRRASQAGIALSVTAILGLAGAERSLAHAAATGRAFSAIDPEYIGVLTLMLEPGTEMLRKVRAGELVLPDAIGMLAELREMIAHTDVSDCLFRSNHASNYLPVGGRLPQDKAAMLTTLDRVLEAPEAARLKPESWRLL
jgi:biotin synthase-like enzyme